MTTTVLSRNMCLFILNRHIYVLQRQKIGLHRVQKETNQLFILLKRFNTCTNVLNEFSWMPMLQKVDLYENLLCWKRFTYWKSSLRCGKILSVLRFRCYSTITVKLPNSAGRKHVISLFISSRQSIQQLNHVWTMEKINNSPAYRSAFIKEANWSCRHALFM